MSESESPRPTEGRTERIVLEWPPVIIDGERVFRRTDTPTAAEYWAFVERTAAEVRANRPAWLRDQESSHV